MCRLSLGIKYLIIFHQNYDDPDGSPDDGDDDDDESQQGPKSISQASGSATSNVFNTTTSFNTGFNIFSPSRVIQVTTC